MGQKISTAEAGIGLWKQDDNTSPAHNGRGGTVGAGGCTVKKEVSKHDRVDRKSVVETRKSEMQTSDHCGEGGECYNNQVLKTLKC